MNEFVTDVEKKLVEAEIKDLPLDVIEKFEEEGDQINADMNADGKIGITAEKMGLVGESLESFMTNFMDNISNEAWDGRTARQFDMGIQTLLGCAGIDPAAVGFEESFEAAGVFMGKEEQKEHAEKGGNNVLKRIWAFLVSCIKKMVAAVSGFFSALDRMASTIEKTGKDIQVMVKGRGFRTGEVKGAWARYLTQGGKEITPIQAIQNSANLTKQVTGAWTTDTVGALNAAKGGQQPKSTSIQGLHWPIEFPGAVSLKLEGGDKDLSNTKFSVVKGEGGKASCQALTRVEADGLIKTIIGSATTVRELRTSLKKAMAQYESIANSLASASEFKRNTDMTSGRQAASLTNKSHTVNKACATILFENVRCAISHIKASFGGSAE